MYKRFTILLAFVLAFSAAEFSVSADEGEFVQQFNSQYHSPSHEAVFERQVQQGNTFNARSASELDAVISAQLDLKRTEFSVVYSGNFSTVMNDMKTSIDRYIYNNDYFRGVVSTWQYGYKGDVLNFNFTYLTSPAEEAFIDRKVKEIARKIVKPSMTDVQKVKAVNDYIVLHASYSYNTKTTPHAVYAILNEGKGVCQAYALLAYRLLDEAGMDVHYVTGYAGEDHAWNLVKVDGSWFHLDTTWNDPVFDASAGDMSDYVRYKYFLVSDQVISRDHRADAASHYPKAVSERFAALRGVSEPVEVDGVMYFVNSDDNIRPYAVNYNDALPRARKLSNTRVQFLAYANEWLYFSNYSKNGYLYKMKLDGSDEALVVQKNVTSIERKGSMLKAYSGKTVIYEEAIGGEGSDPDEVLENAAVEQLIDLAARIQFLHPDFRMNAEKVFDLLSDITKLQQAQLPPSTLEQISLIAEKYDNMNALAFPDSKQWAAQTISDPIKAWKITLSKEVESSEANRKRIKIVDMFGNEVNANVLVNGRTVTVRPFTRYVSDIPYTLVIEGGTLSKDGKKLGGGVHVPFVLR